MVISKGDELVLCDQFVHNGGNMQLAGVVNIDGQLDTGDKCKSLNLEK